MPSALLARPFATGYATTGAACSRRRAFRVISSGSPGPTPRPRRRPVRRAEKFGMSFMGPAAGGIMRADSLAALRTEAAAIVGIIQGALAEIAVAERAAHQHQRSALDRVGGELGGDAGQRAAHHALVGPTRPLHHRYRAVSAIQRH